MVERIPDNHDFDEQNNGRLRRPLLSVALLPSAATLGNLLSGVLAILCCLLALRAAYFDAHPRTQNEHLLAWFPTYIAVGAYLVVLAMVFDALDGRLARITRHTTEFGAQLDSIADIVSFGTAPALLFLTLLLPLAVPPDGTAAIVGKLEWRIGMLAALVFISCAAIRLARYNAENIQAETSQQDFHGLPVPGAAAGMVALLLLHEDLVREQAMLWGVDWAAIARWSIAPAAFVLGMLMVSRLNYVHVFNRYVHREQPLWHLVWLVVFAGIGVFSPQILLLVLAAIYVLSGVILSIGRREVDTAKQADSEGEYCEPAEARATRESEI